MPASLPPTWFALRGGLSVHMADIRLDEPPATAVAVPRGLSLSLLLPGGSSMSMRCGDIAFDGRTAGAQPEGVLVAFAEEDEVRRRMQPGERIRLVGFTIGPEWLGAGGSNVARAIDAFGRRHLATRQWVLSERAVYLAEQMLRPAGHDDFLHRLSLEAQALEILGEAFAQLGEEGPVRDAISARDHRRLGTVRDLVESEAGVGLSIDDIARQAGLNPTTLQRQFRQVYGATIFEVARDYRMGRAQAALELGATVGQAAWLAGYSSPANFATAFRKRFGVSPKHARLRNR
jgi:AraC-like DNA-binding protein